MIDDLRFEIPSSNGVLLSQLLHSSTPFTPNNLVIQNQHRVAVASETVAVFKCHAVCFHHQFVTAEGTFRHKQRRFRMIEVANH